MHTLRVASPHAHLAELMVEHLIEGGFAATSTLREETHLTLRVRPELDDAARTAIFDRVKPYLPRLVVADDLDVDAELVLAGVGGLEGIGLRVTTDSRALTDDLADELTAVGFDGGSTDMSLVTEASMRFGGATKFVRQTLRWLFARRGIELTEQRAWPSGDKDVWITAPDPGTASLAPRERFEVSVQTDDRVAAEPLAARLRAEGFRVNVVALEPPPEGRASKFRAAPGPFARLGTPDDVRALRSAVTELLAERGVDPARWPLRDAVRSKRGHSRTPPWGDPGAGRDPSSAAITAEIRLPLGAHARGKLRPYAGGGADCYEVVLRTDAPLSAAPLLAALRELGFSSVRHERLTDVAVPLRVTAGTLRSAPVLLERLMGAVRDAVRDLSDGTHHAVEARMLPSEDERVFIDLPTAGLADGSYAARLLASLDQWNVSIHHEKGDPTAIITALREAGFRRVRTRRTHADDAAIQHGGIPDLALLKILTICTDHCSTSFELQNMWGPEDRDVFICVPDEAMPSAAGAARSEAKEAEAPDLASWVHGEARAAARPFLESIDGEVRVGSCTLPRRGGERHPLAPSPAEFAHFCIDAITAETLLHLASAVSVREPCLLEGETSTAKTSSVLYLASLLGQPVVRVNLHGQTDTGELVGRYVPDDGEGGSSWRWQEGLVLRAMREGHWLLLDEVNLAEPQILERLNPLLEREPSLVVTEHAGERVGGDELHPDFRVFATMNPAEYAGRSALSPAWRDRWRAHRVLPAPGEREIEQFLRAAVLGESPAIEAGGAAWPSARVAAPWARLARAAGIATFLGSLARFHVSLERALARADGPGRARRERYVVTRRNLLSVLDWMVAHGGTHVAMREALVRYYVERLALADRAPVVRLLDAAGIGPGTWTVPLAAATVAA